MLSFNSTTNTISFFVNWVKEASPAVRPSVIMSDCDQAQIAALHVMTVHLGPYFSFIYFSPSPIYCTVDTLPSLLVTVLSWTYFLIPRWGQDALRSVRLPNPYLLHTLPSPLLYYLCVHQYLLMCTLCALFMPASPHRCRMYHRTFCARFLAPFTCVTPRPLYALS